MSKYEVIESKAYRNKTSGLLVSIYGALPWRSDAERQDWELVVRGWTVQNPVTGQVGTGRPPFPTKEEAEAFSDSLGAPTRICMGD